MCFGNTFEVVAMEKKDEISRPIPTIVSIGIPRLLLSGLNQVQADQIQVMQEV